MEYMVDVEANRTIRYVYPSFFFSFTFFLAGDEYVQIGLNRFSLVT